MTILRRGGRGGGAGRPAGLPIMLMALSLALGGCASMSDAQSTLATKSVPSRVVLRVVNNSCDDAAEGNSESLTTGSVKGLSKVKDGFGIPYDEYAPEYQASPVPITDDSYEANKNRGIGYAGIEDHYVANLMAGQEHSPDHPEFEDCTGGSPTIFPELTTEEEKYGCNMRWEYAASGSSGGIPGYFDFLRGSGPGHRQYVAIHSLVSDKWCICCPWDWGPARAQDGYPPSGSGHYGNIGGVSPQVAEELGFDGHGERSDITLTEWWWVENSDQVKCGPVNDLSALAGGGGSSGGSASGGTTGTSGSSASVATEITTEASARILTAATKGSGAVNPTITEHHDHGFGYWLYQARPHSKNQPLILSLHGSGECGSDLGMLKGTSSLSRYILDGTLQPDCNVLMPQCQSFGWDTGALKSLVDAVVSDTGSNPRKLCVTGVSMGGFGTWDLLKAYPDMFAAAAPIASSGTSSGNDGLERCKAKVKSLIGGADGYDSSGAVAAVKGGGGSAEQVLVPNASHSEMCNIYGNPTYNPVPWMLGNESDYAGSGRSSDSKTDGRTVKIEPANPNSFIDKIHPDLNHGNMPKSQVKYIMMHDTESESDDASAIIQAWIDQGKGISTHFMVDKQGKIFQCVEMDQTGWHSGGAGQGANEKFGLTPTDLNPTGQGSDGDNLMSWYSYGIEIVHEHDDGPYPEAQLDALDRLVAYIDEYLGKEVDIIDHKEWANQDGQTRKQDCSDDFPLQNYKETRNHLGVLTEEDMTVACGEGEEAESSGDGDPSSGAQAIADKAVELAGTATPDPYIAGGAQEKPTDPRLANYVKEKERVYPGDEWWASCCRCSATAIKASGADEDWPLGAPADMYVYAEGATDKWENVGTWRMGDSADMLKTGDVLITTGNHIKIFVGNETVRKKFPGSDANMYDGSAGQHQPWCYNESTSADSREYGIFRLKGGSSSSSSGDSGKKGDDEKMSAKASSSGNNEIDQMLEKAHSIIGSGYSWSGYSWTGDVNTSWFTCSGVPDYCLGYPSWSHSPETFWAEVEAKGHFTTDVSKLKAGDLVFYPYGGRSPCGHVGIYIGNNQIIDSIPNGGVQIRDVNYMECLGGGPILDGVASGTQPGTTKTKPSRYMFVGDSRTCGLYEAVHADLNPDDNSILTGTSAKGSDGTDEFWIGKVGMGAAWLRDTATPIIDSNVKKGDAILIWMGINDHAAQSYADLMSQKAKDWESKGASVYFVSVGPVDEGKAASAGYSDKNADIEAFNSDIKSSLPSEVEWMDIYDKIKQGFDTGDGIHYDDGTSKKIYEWMKEGCMVDGEAEDEEEEEEEEEEHGYNVSVVHTS